VKSGLELVRFRRPPLHQPRSTRLRSSRPQMLSTTASTSSLGRGRPAAPSEELRESVFGEEMSRETCEPVVTLAFAEPVAHDRYPLARGNRPARLLSGADPPPEPLRHVG
jgi:hypothetical protein